VKKKKVISGNGGKSISEERLINVVIEKEES